MARTNVIATDAELRDVGTADHAWLLGLNQACLPAVSPLDAGSLAALLEQIDHARVAERDGARLGAMLALLPGKSYGSTNYAWFEAKGGSFLYVDRVMVAPEARGLGVGEVLYRDTFEAARRLSAPRVTCEVNEDPPNPRSMAFHLRLGFEALTSRVNPTDGKRVVMLERRLERDGSR